MRRLNDSGAAALEYAFVLPALFSLTVGMMDVSRLVWTQVTLDRAVQAAARCAAVNAACADASSIKSFAAGQAWGVGAASADFSVSHPACGVTVSADVPFAFVVSWPGTKISSVKASACYPLSAS